MNEYHLDLKNGYIGPRKCIWFFGPSGCGKSYHAMKTPDSFIKQLNKWFDGYAG